MISDASKTAAAGEYLVLGELLRNRKEAYLAQGSVQPDWDIICIENNNIIRIQVKTIDWPNQTAVNIDDRSKYDRIVVVLLDREETAPTYYIFSKDEIDLFLSKKNPSRKTHKRTITFGKNAKSKYCKYQSNWALD